METTLFRDHSRTALIILLCVLPLLCLPLTSDVNVIKLCIARIFTIILGLLTIYMWLYRKDTSIGFSKPDVLILGLVFWNIIAWIFFSPTSLSRKSVLELIVVISPYFFIKHWITFLCFQPVPCWSAPTHPRDGA